MIRSLIGVIIWVIRLGMIAMLVYFVLGLVAPGSKVFTAAKKYVEPVLAPLRALVEKLLPSLKNVKIDLAPIAAILALEIGILLLRLIRAIL